MGNFFLLVSESLVSFFDEGKLDTSGWEEGDDWLLAFSDNEAVVDSGSESVSVGVLNVSNIEAAWVLFNVLENTDSADVVTTNNQNLSSIFELDQTFNFSSLKIQLQLKKVIKYKYFKWLKENSYLNGVVLLDIGVWVSESSTVVSDNIWNFVLTHGLSFDGAKLEGGFLSVDLVSLESTFHIVEDSEVLSSFLNSDNIHNTEWESGISSDLTVNLDKAFLVSNNLYRLLSAKSISQSISKKDGEWDALSSLVWSSGCSGSVNSS